MNYDNLKIPNHVAIILDGNGRWATEKKLSRSEGHKQGFETLKKISTYILHTGVKQLSVFAFSTENFKRSNEEVEFLMNLFVKKFESEGKYFNKNNVKVIFSGRREKPLPEKVVKTMEKMEETTKNNTGGILNICINYGGQSEIVDATKKIVQEIKENKINIEDINENTFKNYLYQNLEPIDLLIRTSGENRISNFMLWQASYSEFYFPSVYFPDFNEEEFYKAILEYNNRDRRFGGINYEKKSN